MEKISQGIGQHKNGEESAKVARFWKGCHKKVPPLGYFPRQCGRFSFENGGRREKREIRSRQFLLFNYIHHIQPYTLL